MQKTRKLLSDTESNAAEINKYKETTRVTQSTIAELENKLDEREREVNSLKAKVSAWEKDAATSKAEYESKLAISARASEKAIKEKEANLHQELQEQKTAYTALEEQHETEVTEWRKNQSQKDALLEAREKMYNLVKAKSESFQKKETAMKQQLKQAQTALSEANTKHSADIASLQEELEEIKDELKCAEEEVKRYRQSQSSSSKVEAKLKETEKELAAAMAMVASMEKQAQVKQESKVSEDHSINEDKDVTTEQLSSLQLELEEKNKAIVTLKEQLQSQSSGFKSQLLKKDSLLQAENVMLKLVTEKSEAMEAEQARLTQEIHDSEAALVSTKEELGKLKQELKQARDSLSLASQLQFKLEETEKKLALATANATFVAENVDNEASEREREAKLVAEQVQTEDLNTKGAEHVCLQQQLDEKEKECLILKEQLQLETQELKNKLSKKDELLKAKEKMIKLVTAKSESLQKNEASSKRAAMDAKKALEEAVAKHVAEMASYKEEMDDIKDELKYAQQEVSRCRSELKEVCC
jgi:chromosome segregation ATPase